MGAVCGCGAARRRAESAALTGTTGSLCPSSRRRSLERVLRRCCLLVCPMPVQLVPPRAPCVPPRAGARPPPTGRWKGGPCRRSV